MRAVKVLINASLITEVLTTGFTIGEEYKVRIKKGLPPCSKLVSIHWYDMSPDTVELVFENETFDDLRAVPHLEVAVESFVL